MRCDRSHLASQKPSRPASNTTTMRSTSAPLGLAAPAVQEPQERILVGVKLLQRLPIKPANA
jgi:hypothetical protein